jgi:hypothetical protein
VGGNREGLELGKRGRKIAAHDKLTGLDLSSALRVSGAPPERFEAPSSKDQRPIADWTMLVGRIKQIGETIHSDRPHPIQNLTFGDDLDALTAG